MEINEFIIRWFEKSIIIKERQKILEEIEDDSIECERVTDTDIDKTTPECNQ